MLIVDKAIVLLVVSTRLFCWSLLVVVVVVVYSRIDSSVLLLLITSLWTVWRELDNSLAHIVTVVFL